MSEVQPRSETQTEEGFSPWTEEELIRIFAEVRLADLVEYLKDKSEDSIVLSRKGIVHNGVEYNCHLDYTPPDHVDPDQALVPFPERTFLRVENNIGEKPTVQFPVTIDFEPVASPSNLVVSFRVTLLGVDPFNYELVFGDQGNLDDVEYVIWNGRKFPYLFLPADPQLIGSMKINPIS